MSGIEAINVPLEVPSESDSEIKTKRLGGPLTRERGVIGTTETVGTVHLYPVSIGSGEEASRGRLLGSTIDKGLAVRMVHYMTVEWGRWFASRIGAKKEVVCDRANTSKMIDRER